MCCWLLGELPPARGGCGAPGVYGLRGSGDKAYFMLGCEAEAWLVDLRGCTVRRYGMDLLGPGPWRGSDGFNASAAAPGEVFFAGWVVETLPDGLGVRERRIIHVHGMPVEGEEARLLWRREAPGAVTALLYNPVRDSVVAVLGQGYPRPGVYEIPARGGEAKPAAPVNVYAGAWVSGEMCFSHASSPGKAPGLTCLDPLDYRGRSRAVETRGSSVDGHSVGDVSRLVAELHGAAVMIGRQGIALVEGEDEAEAYRLMDLGGCLEPVPGGYAYPDGGLVVAYAPGRGCRLPSVLLRLQPPSARIIAVLGGRVTSIAYMAGRLVAAVAAGHGASHRSLAAIDAQAATRQPLVLRWRLHVEPTGGIPVDTPEARLIIDTGSQAVLTIYAYDLSSGPGGAEKTRYSLSPGVNIVSLEDYRGAIVAASLDRGEAEARILL